MSSKTMFGSNEEKTKTEDESFEDVTDLKVHISKLSVENERYRQQLHDLRRKLQTNVTMQSELIESNQALEQSLKEHKATINRTINEMEEKHVAHRTQLEERIEETEMELAAKSKENRELREIIKINNNALSALSEERNSIGKDYDNSEVLRRRLEEADELLARSSEIRRQLEATVELRESECSEMREILAATKRQLAEKDSVLEGMRDQLMTYRMQLESSKTIPETETSKGNSLFAEVEDRRKMTLEQMTAMRNGYLEAKRSFKAKEAEIRALKTERAMFLRKWEDDTVERIQQDAALLDKYKDRIAELEIQLKNEKKKNSETAKSQRLPESQFTFLQSLVDTKKREVEDLRAKIENDSINSLLKEEARHKMGKQLRYWRFRAMTGEAQLLSIRNRLESDPSSSNVEILETVETLATDAKEIESNESTGGQSSYGEITILDETIATLDYFMTMPKQIMPSTTESELSYLSDVNKTSDTLRASSCERSVLSSTEWTDIPEGLSATDPETREIVTSNIEDRATDSRENYASSDDRAKSEKIFVDRASVTPILKSVLAKPNADLGTIFPSKEASERDKKTLRFTADTIDPPSKTLKKQALAKPKYPIIFIASNKSKD